jgi:formylmethanofuran dehydrogenase subunit E
MELNRRHCFNVLNIPAEKIFKLEHVKVELPSYSRLLDSHICAGCGEKVMETRTIKRGDKYYCIPCIGDSYGQLDWAGVHMMKGKGSSDQVGAK